MARLGRRGVDERGGLGLRRGDLRGRLVGLLDLPLHLVVELQGEPLEVGDHVLIHVGYAIQKVSEADARSAWDLFDEILEHA